MWIGGAVDLWKHHAFDRSQMSPGLVKEIRSCRGFGGDYRCLNSHFKDYIGGVAERKKWITDPHHIHTTQLQRVQ